MDSTLQTAPQNADGSGAMFDRIAARYDRLNRILSLGMDRGWRRAAVKALSLAPGMRILDLATGTGDLALAIAAAEERVSVVGVDPSPRMLEVASEKLGRRGSSVSFELGDAQHLVEHASNSFDGSTIAFGIRNVPDRIAGLREMARVTRPGGRVVVLELSEPGGGPISFFARLYVHQVVPRIGAFLSGASEYRYLQESIEAFPPAAEFVEMMERVGLEDVSVRSLAFGACHLYVGRATESN